VQKSLDAILTKTTLRDLLRNEEDMIAFLHDRTGRQSAEPPVAAFVNSH